VEILKKFTHHIELPVSPWMSEIQAFDGYLYATDRIKAIRKKGSLGAMPTNQAPLKSLELLKGMFNNSHQSKVNISRVDLEKLISSLKTKECFKTVSCEACDGRGEVDFEFYNNGKTYQLEGDCPVCSGTGEIGTGQKVGFGFETNSVILIADKMLVNPAQLETFLQVPVDSYVFKTDEANLAVNILMGEYEAILMKRIWGVNQVITNLKTKV